MILIAMILNYFKYLKYLGGNHFKKYTLTLVIKWKLAKNKF